MNVEQFKKDVEELFSQTEFNESVSKEGAVYLYGPYGSFIFVLNDPQYDGKNGFIVSVNGEAVDSVYLALSVTKQYPDLEFFGHYSERFDGNGIVIDDESVYDNQRQFIMAKANLIQSFVDAELAKKQSKLIVPDQRIVV
jgi:hypothetical protein